MHLRFPPSPPCPVPQSFSSITQKSNGCDGPSQREIGAVAENPWSGLSSLTSILAWAPHRPSKSTCPAHYLKEMA